MRLALTVGFAVLAAGPVTAAAPIRPAHGLPKILSVFVSAHDVLPGQAVTARVETSPNVGYVEARIENYNRALTRRAAGKFTLAYTVPLYLSAMPWLKHRWFLQIIARSVDGVETRKLMPITLH